MARLAGIAPELPTANLSAAIDFYEKLNFTLVSHTPQRGYAVVERDGIALHLFEDRLRRSSAVGVHLFTPDLAELFEEFADRGIHFTQNIQRKPWGNRDFRIKDDFGNELKFTEPVLDDQ